MNSLEIFLTILIMAAGTAATRFVSFWLFPAHKKTPNVVIYLGKVLPYSVMGMLIVYCLKDVSILHWSHGLPEFIAIGATAALHLWKKNMMISISAGTILYMILIQFVFN
ncbi:MAG: branched-chain amino acid transporter permease [Eubacteriales bacterium]|nr:branched-chain amino acid transporter permease [Eubacteriales bacterium]